MVVVVVVFAVVVMVVVILFVIFWLRSCHEVGIFSVTVVVVGGCWWLLVVVGGCWWLLVVVGGCWGEVLGVVVVGVVRLDELDELEKQVGCCVCFHVCYTLCRVRPLFFKRVIGRLWK